MCVKFDPPFEVLAARSIALSAFLLMVSCALIAHEPSVIELGAHGVHVPFSAAPVSAASRRCYG